MIERSPDIPAFQTFYLSREQSSCFLINDVVDLIKRIAPIDDLNVSLRFGNRVLINSKFFTCRKINTNNFVEIVDYDPFRRILLVIGKEDACDEAPLHWYLHHAREDINIAILIKDKRYFDKRNEKIPIIDSKYPLWSIEKIKEVLGALKNSRIVILKGSALLLVGKSLKEVENLFLNYVRNK